MVFGAIWSIGATSDTDSRVKFDELLREALKGKHPEYPIPETVASWNVTFPENGLVHDFFFEVRLFFIKMLTNLLCFFLTYFEKAQLVKI